MSFSDELVGLFATLEERAVQYAVGGEVGAAFQGPAKMARSLELLIRGGDLPTILAIAGERGFRAAGPASAASVGGNAQAAVHTLLKGQDPDHLTLRLIPLSPPWHEVWRERRLYQWQETKVQVASSKSLAKMKAAHPAELERLSRASGKGMALDMSAAAIERRIQEHARNYELGVSLRCAKNLGKAEELLAQNNQGT